jgi:hypothetical protein
LRRHIVIPTHKELKKTLEEVGKRLKVEKLEDWYHITLKEFINAGGYTVTHFFENSLYASLNGLYPDFKWQPWKFVQIPTDHWNWKDPVDQGIYFEWICHELGMKCYIVFE